MSTLLSRRAFFCGLAAPAIVHAGNLMPVKALRPPLRFLRGELSPVFFAPRELYIRQAFVDVFLTSAEPEYVWCVPEFLDVVMDEHFKRASFFGSSFSKITIAERTA